MAKYDKREDHQFHRRVVRRPMMLLGASCYSMVYYIITYTKSDDIIEWKQRPCIHGLIYFGHLEARDSSNVIDIFLKTFLDFIHLKTRTRSPWDCAVVPYLQRQTIIQG